MGIIPNVDNFSINNIWKKLIMEILTLLIICRWHTSTKGPLYDSISDLSKLEFLFVSSPFDNSFTKVANVVSASTTYDEENATITNLDEEYNH